MISWVRVNLWVVQQEIQWVRGLVFALDIEGEIGRYWVCSYQERAEAL
jgi:hypothetical protein